jgi:hypothetical protein
MRISSRSAVRIPISSAYCRRTRAVTDDVTDDDAIVGDATDDDVTDSEGSVD